MKKSEFIAEYNYTDQVPRCHVCKHYASMDLNSKRFACHVIPGERIKVKPNGICKAYKAYKAGVHATCQPKDQPCKP